MTPVQSATNTVYPVYDESTPVADIETKLTPLLDLEDRVLVDAKEVESFVQLTLNHQARFGGITEESFDGMLRHVMTACHSIHDRREFYPNGEDGPQLSDGDTIALAKKIADEVVERGFIGPDVERAELRERVKNSADFTYTALAILNKWDLDEEHKAVMCAEHCEEEEVALAQYLLNAKLEGLEGAHEVGTDGVVQALRGNFDTADAKVKTPSIHLIDLKLVPIRDDATGEILVTTQEIKRLIEWVVDAYRQEGITERTIARAILSTVRGVEKISDTLLSLGKQKLTGEQKKRIAIQVLNAAVDELYPGSEEGRELLKLLIPSTIDTIVASLNTDWGPSEPPAICKLLSCK